MAMGDTSSAASVVFEKQNAGETDLLQKSHII